MQQPLHSAQLASRALLAAFLIHAAALSAYSQGEAAAENSPPHTSETSIDSLPDAPTPITSNNPSADSSMGFAPKYATVIEPEYIAVRLGPKSKVSYAMHELFFWSFPTSVLISAGIEQAGNGNPLYGNNATAFAQRLGASAARQSAQIIFSDAVFSSLYREDPRYYALGPRASFIHRFGYAATRVVVTKTDRGGASPNLAMLSGYLGSAALTQLYYPVRSRDSPTIISGYGFSLGGHAIGNEIREFARFLNRHQPSPEWN